MEPTSKLATYTITSANTTNGNQILNPNESSVVTVHENTKKRSSEQGRQQVQLVGVGPAERQLSLLDPLSDRVSTILVWHNLTVSSWEEKHRRIFKKIKSCNKYVSKPKCLLNNISGAITGGLWAVMGKLSFPFSAHELSEH